MIKYKEDDSTLRKCVHHGTPHTPLPNTLHNPNKKVPQYTESLVCEVGLMLAAMLRPRRPVTLLWGLLFCFFFVFYISLPSPTSERCDCPGRQEAAITNAPSESQRIYPKDKHKMALLIPFRDRFEELLEFAPHIHHFLNSQHKNHHIFIINQVDGLRFNRAMLLNVGLLESGPQYDHVALHDVDLLPVNPALLYPFPADGPYHVAAPHLHPRYHYPTFIGGILLIKREQFVQVDGLSTKYWGWGLEDDEFFARLKEAKLEVMRPGNLTSGIKTTFRHIHDRRVRRRDMVKCYNQQEITRHRDRHTGLSTTRYHVQSRKEVTIEGAPLTIINVVLECDKTVTPWCDCTENIGNTLKSQQKSKPEDVIVPKLNRKKHLTPDG